MPTTKTKTTDPPEVTEAARDVDGTPYCVKHHCRMKQTSGGKSGSSVAYYSCPVDGCTETGKMIKSSRHAVVPKEPQACPRCRQRESNPVYCERDDHHSNGAKTILVCPRCGWKSNAQARPELAAFHDRRPTRNVSEEIGSR